MYQAGRKARKLAHRATDKRLCIFRDFARKSLRARSALECGPASRDRFCGSSFLGVLPEASFRRRKAVPQGGTALQRPPEWPGAEQERNSSKLTGRRENVYENKGPLWKTCGRSWNVIENKDSYTLEAGMLCAPQRRGSPVGGSPTQIVVGKSGS